MYVPAAFSEKDESALYEFISQNSFATLITHDGSDSYASHLNLIIDEKNSNKKILIGHLAKANLQTLQFKAETNVLAIFTGAHSYISPTWYENNKDVPTWNYMAVHIRGVLRKIIDQEKLKQFLEQLILKYESLYSSDWKIDWTDDKYSRFLNMIVGFEIEITSIQGKFKLSQNRSIQDQIGVVNGLSRSQYLSDQQMAEVMCDYFGLDKT